MTSFRFTGEYPANVQLPDGSVQLMEPGDTVDLPADAQPNPVLVAVDAPTAPAPAPAGDTAATTTAADAAAAPTAQ